MFLAGTDNGGSNETQNGDSDDTDKAGSAPINIGESQMLVTVAVAAFAVGQLPQLVRAN